MVLMDLLWSDPTTNDGVEGVQPSPRGPGLVTFGPDRVKEFCKVTSPSLTEIRAESLWIIWRSLLSFIEVLLIAKCDLRFIIGSPRSTRSGQGRQQYVLL